MSSTPTIRLETMAFGGAAIGRLASGKVALVQGGAPGELVRIEPLQEKSSHLIATVVEVVEPSPDRVEPRCVSAGRCGGCGWMHLDAAAQRSWKRRLLEGELARAGVTGRASTRAPGGGDVEVEAVREGEPLGCRVRTRMHLVGGRFGTLGRRSHEVVPLVECPILEPRLEAFALAAAAALEGEEWSDAEIELVLDLEGRRGMSVELVSSSDPSPWRELARSLSVECLHVASRRGRTLALEGPRLTESSSAGISLEFTPGIFTQSNREMNGTLVDVAIAAAGEGRTFAELYAGVGNFTVHLARRFRRGLACEGSREAVRLLRRNLGPARSSVEVAAERDGRSARRLASRPPVELLLADPPRAGIRPLRPLFAASPPKRVVLVSCHPMAAVRDLAHLCGEVGYRLRRVVPVDMFPQTPHLELVAEVVR